MKPISWIPGIVAGVRLPTWSPEAVVRETHCAVENLSVLYRKGRKWSALAKRQVQEKDVAEVRSPGLSQLCALIVLAALKFHQSRALRNHFGCGSWPGSGGEMTSGEVESAARRRRPLVYDVVCQPRQCIPSGIAQ